MKNNIHWLLLLIGICSACKKETITPIIEKEQIITYKSAGEIAFKLSPLSDSTLKLAIDPQLRLEFDQVILKSGNQTLSTAKIEVADVVPFAIIKHNFKKGEDYSFLIDQKPDQEAVVNQYQIAHYKHEFVNNFKYEKVLSITQGVGSNAIDISPTKNSLFVVDRIANISYIKQINLSTLDTKTLSYNLNGTMLRSISDNELLVFGDNKTTTGVPSGVHPGHDAIILARHQISTGKNTFVDYVSSGYGRFSKVIDHKILVTNPIFTDKTASLIDLSKNSSIAKYSLDAFDFRYINERISGQLIYTNRIIDSKDGQIGSALTGNDPQIFMADATSGYYASASAITNANEIATRFHIYKDNLMVYQSDLKKDRLITFPSLALVDQDVIIFHQYFGYETKLNIDGYYALNLKTKELKLLQADSPRFGFTHDYQLNSGIFAVRTDGVYKLTSR